MEAIGTPRNLCDGSRQPLSVLVQHGVDHVDGRTQELQMSP